MLERAAELLRDTDQGFPPLWELAADAMALCDPEGIVLLANAAYFELYGCSPGEVLGQNFARILPEERRANAVAHYRSLFQDETLPSAFEGTVHRRDGTERYVEARVSFLTRHGQRVLALNVIRDITQRKQAEAALQAERDLLRQIVETLPEGLVIADEDGQFLLTNQAAQDIFGQDLTGRHVSAGERTVFRLEHPDRRPYSPAELPLNRALARGETVRSEQITFLHAKAGQEIPLLVSAAPLRDSGGRITRAILILQDISALRALERLRDEWISVIAEDLRQPLTVILGSVTLLREMLRSHPGLDREKHRLEQARVAALTQSKMIGDLIDSFRIEMQTLVPDRQIVDVPAFVQDRVERMTHRVGGHLVERAVRGEGAPVALDPTLIGRVVENLLSNAAKYGLAGSEIRVEVEQRRADVRVSVTNQGPGIAPEELPRLFSRFHRVRGPRYHRDNALGLGLSIAKGLVELHGGRIWVESSPDQTTTFHFTIPRSGGREPSG